MLILAAAVDVIPPLESHHPDHSCHVADVQTIAAPAGDILSTHAQIDHQISSANGCAQEQQEDAGSRSSNDDMAICKDASGTSASQDNARSNVVPGGNVLAEVPATSNGKMPAGESLLKIADGRTKSGLIEEEKNMGSTEKNWAEAQNNTENPKGIIASFAGDVGRGFIREKPVVDSSSVDMEIEENDHTATAAELSGCLEEEEDPFDLIPCTQKEGSQRKLDLLNLLPPPPTPYRFKYSCSQCCGSVTFWYGSKSGVGFGIREAKHWLYAYKYKWNNSSAINR